MNVYTDDKLAEQCFGKENLDYQSGSKTKLMSPGPASVVKQKLDLSVKITDVSAVDV